MHNQPAPASDGLSDNSIPPDQLLRWQLDKAVSRLFYESCNGVTQALLMDCHWYLSTKSAALTLVLDCPNPAIYGRILNYGVAIGDRLTNLASQAYIHLCPPAGSNAPVAIWTVFQEELSDSRGR
jgi:hypothetical protein